MKRTSLTMCAVVVLTLLAGCRNYDTPGSGPLVLSPDMKAYYDQYLAHSNPQTFIVSDDGRYASYLTCPGVACKVAGDVGKSIEKCETASGTNCYVFAKGRSIVWEGKITDLKDGEILTAAGAVAVPDGDIRRTWCHNGLPGNKMCLALDAAHHEKCVQFDTNLEAYSTCRTRLIAGLLYDNELDPKTPNIVACNVGGDRPAEVTFELCQRMGGSIARALRPLLFSWDGVAKNAEGMMDYVENQTKGKAILHIAETDQRCTGTYEFTERGKGTWQLDCPVGLSASGTFKTNGFEGADGTGTDTQGRAVTFTLAPQDYEGPLNDGTEPNTAPPSDIRA